MNKAITVEPETRILLIEDDLAFTALILAYLSEAPTVRLDSASTLTAGIEFLRRGAYDAILLDLNLPDSRGIVTLKTVREHGPKIPIVVLTATDDDDLAIQLLQNGAEEYLVKSSVKLNKLVRVVKIAIERKRVTERLGLLESVVLNTNDAVVISECSPNLPKEERKIVFINETFTKLSGYQADEIIGQPIGQLFAPTEAQSAQVDSTFAEGTTIQLETMHHRKDDSEISIDLSIFPVINETGKITHWVHIFRDASDRKQSEENERQISLMKQREDFAAVLAHDLKTPVIGTNRLLGILLGDSLGPLTDSQRELLVLMQKDSEHSLQKIQNVLEVFRFDVTRNELKVLPTDLAPIILDCVNEQKARTIARELNFELTIPTEIRDVLMDANAIKKVLTNILDNAVKFSPPGGTIIVAAIDNKHNVKVVVLDQGPGISKEQQKNLFNRIWQGGPKTQYSANTGLGLYISKQLITAHDGVIECISDIGKGTETSILLKKKVG
jgi:PAS domain S-box-containing protein